MSIDTEASKEPIDMQNIAAWMINDDLRRALRDGRALAAIRDASEDQRLASHPIPRAGGPSLSSRLAALRQRFAGTQPADAGRCTNAAACTA